MNTAVASPQAGNAGVTETAVSPAALPDDFDPMAEAVRADAEQDGAQTSAEPKVESQEPAAKPGEQGATKPTEQKPAKPGAQGKAPETTETAASKEQRETERRDRSWKALDAEKNSFRAEKQQILNQFQAMQRELSQLKQQSAGPAKDEHGHTAETYEALEKKCRREGDDEMADAARARADKLRRQTPAAETSQTAQTEPWTTPQFQQEWQRNTAELIADSPELDDPANPITKAANTLLADKQWAGFFRSRPDGIRAAVEVARLVQKSAEIDAAREELKTAKAEIERLHKLTQPRGSHPAGQPDTTRKAPEAMTEDEVMAIAREADRGG